MQQADNDVQPLLCGHVAETLTH